MKRIRSENDEQRNEEEEDLNLLDYLPFDMIAQILTHLDVPDLLAFSLGCKAFYDVSQADRIWFPLCQNLWQGKQLYHNKTDKDRPELSWRAAYVMSLVDSKRKILSPEELYRFKWLFSTSVRIAGNVTDVKQATFYPNGFVTIDTVVGSSTRGWALVSGDRMETFHFRYTVSEHSYFDVSRNAADWGWKMTTYNDELYQTFDPSLPSPRPLVQICTRLCTYLSTGTFGKDGKTILLDPVDVEKMIVDNIIPVWGDDYDDSDYDSSYNEEEEAWKD